MMGSWVEVNGWETMVDGKIEVMGRKSFTEGKKVQGGLFPLYTQVTWRLWNSRVAAEARPQSAGESLDAIVTFDIVPLPLTIRKLPTDDRLLLSGP
jgi:hypothetical protein